MEFARRSGPVRAVRDTHDAEGLSSTTRPPHSAPTHNRTRPDLPHVGAMPVCRNGAPITHGEATSHDPAPVPAPRRRTARRALRPRAGGGALAVLGLRPAP